MKWLLLLAFLSLLVLTGVIALSETVTSCAAEDDEKIKDTFAGACDDVTGSFLEQDDGSLETHTYDKNAYAGVRVESVNTSVTDCISISKVEVCYEWWTTNVGAGPSDCDISVDANNGISYSTASTTCPGTTANPGVSCIDVSLLESWNCTHFFGSTGVRALAKSELTRVPGGKGSVETSSWDVFYFNVTYVPETVDITLQFTDIEWVSVNPNSVDNAATGNAAGHTIRLEAASNVNADLYIKGDDLINGLFSLGVGNITWSMTNDPGTSIPLTTSYALVASNQVPGVDITTYFWLDVPSGQRAVQHTGLIYFKAVKNGESP